MNYAYWHKYMYGTQYIRMYACVCMEYLIIDFCYNQNKYTLTHSYTRHTHIYTYEWLCATFHCTFSWLTHHIRCKFTMIDLEDLPRMQSLSPVKDIEGYTAIPTTPLIPKKTPKACRPLVVSKLLIKPTIASTPAKLTTPTTPAATVLGKGSDSLETPTVQRNGLCFGFNYNTLVRPKTIFLIVNIYNLFNKFTYLS